MSEIDLKFIKMIEESKLILNKIISDVNADKRFVNRYNTLMKELDDTKNSIINKTFYIKTLCLNVSMMIDRNDPEELIDAIGDLNRYYCKYYREID